MHSTQAIYTPTHIETRINEVILTQENQCWSSSRTEYQLRTRRTPSKLGVMIVGMGGNVGSTFMAGLLMDKHDICWQTKEKWHQPNWIGSITQGAKIALGDSFVGFSEFLPLVQPTDIVVSGWDINKCNLHEAIERAAVLDVDLQMKLRLYTSKIHPLRSFWYPSFLSDSQWNRVNHLWNSLKHKIDDLNHIRKDIAQFREANELDLVIVVYAASTERNVNLSDAIFQTAENWWEALHNDDISISPSQVFAVASIQEGSPFLNMGAQNTLVPAIRLMAQERHVLVCGDDLKTQSLHLGLLNQWVQAGYKVSSLVTNHQCGNNDALNCDAYNQNAPREALDEKVIQSINEEPIDYLTAHHHVASLGDTKLTTHTIRSQTFLDGIMTLEIRQTCEESLLAAPQVLDLCIVLELLTRIQWKQSGESWQNISNASRFLSHWLKNGDFSNENDLEPLIRLMKACLGLGSIGPLYLE